MLNHAKPNVEKIPCIDAELTGHVHKLDVKLQSLCGSGFSLFVVRMLAKPYYHFGVNRPRTLCENKDGVSFFTLKYECHCMYNKLLLCNSENGDIASCNKNNSEWGCCVFSLKNCFFSKNPYLKKLGGLFFFKTFFSIRIIFQSFRVILP